MIPKLEVESVPQNYPVPVIVPKPVPYQVMENVLIIEKIFVEALMFFLSFFLSSCSGGETSVQEGGEEGAHAHRENNPGENREAGPIPRG